MLEDEAARAREAESERLHGYVGWVLRLGMGVSVLLLSSGLALRIARGVDDSAGVRLWDLAGNGMDLGLELMTVGVLALALTPALRVLALVGLWWRQRDWRFVLVALAVVAMLGVGVVLGKGG